MAHAMRPPRPSLRQGRATPALHATHAKVLDNGRDFRFLGLPGLGQDRARKVVVEPVKAQHPGIGQEIGRIADPRGQVFRTALASDVPASWDPACRWPRRSPEPGGRPNSRVGGQAGSRPAVSRPAGPENAGWARVPTASDGSGGSGFGRSGAGSIGWSQSASADQPSSAASAVARIVGRCDEKRKWVAPP